MTCWQFCWIESVLAHRWGSSEWCPCHSHALIVYMDRDCLTRYRLRCKCFIGLWIVICDKKSEGNLMLSDNCLAPMETLTVLDLLGSCNSLYCYCICFTWLQFPSNAGPILCSNERQALPRHCIDLHSWKNFRIIWHSQYSRGLAKIELWNEIPIKECLI